MSDESGQPDPAAVLGCALSLWHECKKLTAGTERLNPSECYHGGDEFMRVVMRTATRFENRASLHIAFEELDDVWPYMMEGKFGAACVSVMGAGSLAPFDDSDCLRVALRLGLPVKSSAGVPVPIDRSAPNPVAGSVFQSFRIRTVRDSLEDETTEAFTLDDEPFDENFGAPYFGLYGVDADGVPEHIADRRTYAEAVSLAEKLAPGIPFDPAAISPTFSPGRSGTR
jgi:hypothetical protein